MKVKLNQVWVSKSDGRLLFIGRKNSAKKWNTTNSLSKENHSMSDETINKYYELYAGDVTEAVKNVEELNYVVCRATNATFKPCPKWMPKKIHKLLINMLIDIHEIKIRKMEK